MTQNKNINANVGYTVNQAALQQVVAANNTVAQSYVAANKAAALSFADPQAAANALGVTMAQLSAMTGQNAVTAGVQINQNVTVPMQVASTATQQLIHDIGDLGRDIQAIPEPDLSAFGVADAGGGGGVNLTGSRRGISALGSLVGGQAGGAFGDVARIVSVGAAFGAVGVIGAGLALTLGKVSEAEKAADDAGKKFADDLSSIQQEIAAGAGSKDIQKTIDDLTKLKAAQQQTYDQLNELETRHLYLITHTELPDTADQIQALNTQIAAISGGTTSIDNLSGATDEAKANLDKTTASIGLYNVEINTQAVKLNDATTAVEAVGERLGKAISGVSFGMEVAAIDIGGIVGKFFDDISAGVTSANDAYLQELAVIGKAEDAITALNQKLADADTAARQKSIALEQDYQLRRGEIEDDAFAKRVKDAQVNADAVNKIETTFARSYEQAIGDRDALAARAARTKRQDDLDNQAIAYKRQQDATNDAEAKQLRSLEDNYQRQQAAIDDAYNKQRDSINAQLRQRQADLEAADAALRAIDLTAQQTHLSDFYSHQVQMLQIQQAGNQLIEAAFGQGLGQIGVMIDQFFGAGTGGIGAAVGGFLNTLPPYTETGGSSTPFPTGQPVYGARGMGGFSAAQGGKSGDVHLTYQPVINGLVVKDALNLMDQRFVSYLKDAGFIGS